MVDTNLIARFSWPVTASGSCFERKRVGLAQSPGHETKMVGLDLVPFTPCYRSGETRKLRYPGKFL